MRRRFFNTPDYLGFEAYIAPADFDRSVQPVDIYDVFIREKSVRKNAAYIYSYTDSLPLTLSSVLGVSYLVSEVVDGRRNDTFTSEGNAFTTGSTARYIIVYDDNTPNGIYNCALPNGTVWGYITKKYNSITAAGGYLKQVHVEDLSAIIHIQNSAFSACINLSGVLHVPPLVTTIGNNAFIYNYYITDIEFNEVLISVGTGAFSWCHRISALNLPESLTSIGNSAFAMTSPTFQASVADIVISPYISFIGDAAFSGIGYDTITSNSPHYSVVDNILYTAGHARLLAVSRTRTTDVNVHNDTTEIASGAMYNCRLIHDIVLSNKITIISTNAMAYCTGVTTPYTLPGTLRSIGNSAFQDNQSRQGALVIPEGVTNIGASAFSGNVGITSLSIPTTIVSIWANAFGGNININDLTLNAPYNPPTSLTSTAFNYKFDFSDILSAESVNQSIINITSGTPEDIKTLTIGNTNKERLLSVYPNAETDANSRNIYID
ncbi:leucine-rich repeat domain-containing protein [Paludibacter sp. 221]|uniref:leucine-rich repeat domain-containing protein n=1 Tax=Paludibacter sp. 221 TaxID=2302939 RepID=UPI0013D0697C|nr:leucine-rich repeat domain-containing protein [Paludibacter sp. 221]NDV46266.1 leucine-rich repeat domain-containing protein [Paludibacter sp. 221]